MLEAAKGTFLALAPLRSPGFLCGKGGPAGICRSLPAHGHGWPLRAPKRNRRICLALWRAAFVVFGAAGGPWLSCSGRRRSPLTSCGFYLTPSFQWVCPAAGRPTGTSITVRPARGHAAAAGEGVPSGGAHCKGLGNHSEGNRKLETHGGAGTAAPVTARAVRLVVDDTWGDGRAHVYEPRSLQYGTAALKMPAGALKPGSIHSKQKGRTS